MVCKLSIYSWEYLKMCFYVCFTSTVPCINDNTIYFVHSVDSQNII